MLSAGLAVQKSQANRNERPAGEFLTQGLAVQKSQANRNRFRLDVLRNGLIAYGHSLHRT